MMKKNVKQMLAVGASVLMLAQPVGVMAAQAADSVTDAEGYTLTWTVGGSGEAFDEETQEGMAATKVTLSCGEAEDTVLLNCALEAGESSLHLLCEIDDEVVRFSVPETGDDVMYQIDAAKWLSVYGAEEETEEVEAETEGYDPFQDVEVDEDAWNSVLAPYAGRLLEFGLECADFDEGEMTLQLLGAQTEGTIITFTLTGTGLAELLNDLADQLEADDELRSLIADVAQQLAAMNAAGQAVGEKISAQMGTEELTSEAEAVQSAEEGIAAVQEMIDQLPDMMRSGAESLTELGDFTLCTITTLLGEDHLAMLDISVLGAEVTDESYIGLHYEKFDNQISAKAGMGEQALTLNASYDHSEEKAEGQFEIDYLDQTVANGSYDFDLTQETILGVPYGACSIAADVLESDMGLTIANAEDGSDDFLFTVNAGDETGMNFWCNMNAAAGAELTAPSGEIQDISDYSTDDAKALVDEIFEKVNAQAESAQ